MVRCRYDDSKWPEPDNVGKQELEVVDGDTHIAFAVRAFFVFYKYRDAASYDTDNSNLFVLFDVCNSVGKLDRYWTYKSQMTPKGCKCFIFWYKI